MAIGTYIGGSNLSYLITKLKGLFEAKGTCYPKTQTYSKSEVDAKISQIDTSAYATKEELETKIACEKLAKPKVSAEFMTFWLQRFRKLDVRQKSHRKMLIDTFINAIFLYDDKMVITFNYKEGTTTITFDDLKTALADQETGSDLDCSTAPPKGTDIDTMSVFFLFAVSSVEDANIG